MTKRYCLVAVLVFCSFTLFAQERLEGFYDHNFRTFRAKDPHIIGCYFSYDTLAPFMIKGADPHQSENNRVGFIDTTGRIVIPPVYNDCSFFDGEYAAVVLAGKSGWGRPLGVIDRKGKIIIPIEYEMLVKCQNGLLAVKKAGELGFITINNKIVVPFGKYSGYARPRQLVYGDDVQDTVFRWYPFDFKAGVVFKRYIGVLSGKKWAVIDSTGTEVVPPKFNGIEPFINNLAVIKMAGKSGVADPRGNIVIPAIYDNIWLPGKDYLYAHIGNKVGVLSLDNRVIIPIEFGHISVYGNGFIAQYAGYDGRSKLFDYHGRQLAEMDAPKLDSPFWGQPEKGFFAYDRRHKKFKQYQYISAFEEGYENTKNRLFFYKRGNKWGVIDTTVREITPPLFDSCSLYKIGYLMEGIQHIAVLKNNKWGLIDTTGKMWVKPAYDDLRSDQGALYVKKADKWGLFDHALKPATPVKYDSLVVIRATTRLYSNNPPRFIRSGIGKKWGLINPDGREIIPPAYDEIAGIIDELALVKNNSKYGLVNLDGKQMADCIYDKISIEYWNRTDYYMRCLLTKKDGKYGLVNADGLEIAPPVYDTIAPTFGPMEGKYRVVQHGKSGVLDGRYGVLMIPCIYDHLKFDDSYIQNGAYVRTPYITAFKNGYCGLVDTMGKVHLPVVYDRINFQNGTYNVSVNGRCGLLDSACNWMIPLQYEWISYNSEHKLYTTQIHGKYGLVNFNGDVITEAIYSNYWFCGDMIIVEKDHKFGAVDRQGKMLEPCIYDGIECANRQLLKRSGKGGQ